jgi:1-phosphofructokinase
MIVTVTPNPSVDWTFDIRSLDRGQLNRARDSHAEPSGKGVNVSRALAANGISTTAVLPVGGPVAVEMTALLAEENVDFVPVQITGSVRVNVSLAEPDGLATKINSPGPALSPAEIDELVARTLERTNPGDWVVGSGSLPPGVSQDLYARICEGVHQRGARFALDSSGAALAAGLPARPDVIKPNIDELAEVTGAAIQTFGDAADGARQLLTRGAGCVLVSAGPDGALLVTDGLILHAVGHVQTARSTVGAGDALLAGFIASGADGASALCEATAWASAALGTRGSHVPVVRAVHRDVVQLTQAVDLGRPLRNPADLRGPGPRLPESLPAGEPGRQSICVPEEAGEL